MQGDTAAYEELVRRHEQIAFRTAYLITGDAAEAEDAAQEAFVKAYYALARFRPDASLRPWLLKIVANEARNRRVARGRRARLLLRAAADLPAAPVAPSPESAAEANERRELLLRAVGNLRDQDRQVVVFRYFLDLSEAEMAAALGCR
ncbi:MAG: RNA polymerase sigma factor, partial [Dehalococcoidia bacterium]